jgi:hypothetical protein
MATYNCLNNTLQKIGFDFWSITIFTSLKLALKMVLGLVWPELFFATSHERKTILTFLNPTSTNIHRLPCIFSEKYGKQFLLQAFFLCIFQKTRVPNFPVFSVKIHRNVWIFVLIGFRKF